MPHVANPLEDFASYNTVWTMACATPGEVNAGAYRTRLKNVIFSSAGRYEKERVSTAYGTPEYFIDNVEIKCFVTPTPPSGNASQIKINFEIFEPFSLGLFLQSCQAAAIESGYKSYLDNAPYVLKLEFKGQKTTGEFSEIGPYYFLVRLKKVEFTVNEAGSKYKVETFPYNHQLFNASINSTFNDIRLVGKNAYDVLVGNPENSLVTQLTTRELQLVKDKKKRLPDYYAVEFVDCDWGGPNPFGSITKGDLEFQPTSTGGTEVFKRKGDVEGKDGKVIRGKMSIVPREKSLQFSSGTAITDILNSVILSTKEARENATDDKKIDDKGFITWWRLDADIQLLEYDESIKDYNKVIKFKIVPYKIHHSVFLGPEAASKGVKKLKGELVKEYNYIYTGKNTDVLKFDIEIKNLFFTATDPNKQEDTAVQANPGANASVPPEAPTTKKSEGTAPPATAGNAPVLKPSINAGALPFKAGSGRMDSKQKIANEFYVNALTKNKDMINLDIDLLGDPFWLPENGQGNYHPTGRGSPVADGTMNYENRDIFVGVFFRTPTDVRGADGLMVFQDAGRISPFSGLFKVTEVVHSWSGNVYKCKLKGPRMPAQDIESSGSLFPVLLGEPQKPKSKPSDEPGAT
jgi:hypothetical protein